MLLTALKRPFTSARTFLGLLFSAIPLVGMLAMGYKMACASATMRGSYDLPRWRAWKDLLFYGFKARIIQLIWLLPAIIIFGLLWTKVNALQLTLESPNLQDLLAIKSLFKYAITLAFLALLFMPASLMNFVAEAKFKSAFTASAFRRMLTKNYILAWLLSALIVCSSLALFLLFTIYSVNLLSAYPMAVGYLYLLLEVSLIWFPGVMVWTLFGDAWKNILQKEFSQT